MKAQSIKRMIASVLMCVSLAGVVSCGDNEQPYVPDDTYIPDEGVETIDFDKKDYVSRGSIGGYLIDLGVNILLSSGAEYLCSLTPSTGVTDYTLTFESTKPEYVTVRKVDNSDSEFYIVAVSAGDSILKIYDVDGVLVYRNIVRVREPYAANEITKVMYDNDIYRGHLMLGKHRLSVLSYTDTTFVAQIKGSDDYETIDVTVEGTYVGYVEVIDSYEFSLTTKQNTSNTQTKMTELYITRVSDEIKLYYQNGIFNFFYAAKYSYLHAGELY